MSLLSRLLDFAGRKFAEEYRGGNATSPIAARLPCSGYDETAQLSIRWGAAATEQPHCNAPAADFARDDVKSLFHVRKDAA